MPNGWLNSPSVNSEKRKTWTQVTRKTKIESKLGAWWGNELGHDPISIFTIIPATPSNPTLLAPEKHHKDHPLGKFSAVTSAVTSAKWHLKLIHVRFHEKIRHFLQWIGFVGENLHRKQPWVFYHQIWRAFRFQFYDFWEKKKVTPRSPHGREVQPGFLLRESVKHPRWWSEQKSWKNQWIEHREHQKIWQRIVEIRLIHIYIYIFKVNEQRLIYSENRNSLNLHWSLKYGK